MTFQPGHIAIARKTVIVLAARLLLVAVGFFIKAIQTRYLGPEKYGFYALFATVTGVAVFFFRFGFFASLQLLLTEARDKAEERALAGAGILVVLLNGILFSVFLFTSSFFVDEVFDAQIGTIVRAVSPLCFLFPFQFFMSAWGMGTGRVEQPALFEVLSKGFYLIALLVLVTFSSASLDAFIYLLVLTGIVSTMAMLMLVRPRFASLSSQFNRLWQKTRSYGYNLYLGSTANTLTYRLDELFISAWVNTTQLGFYTLSMVFCTPINMVSQAVSQTLFKQFASQPRISNRVLWGNVAWIIVSVGILVLIGEPLVVLILGEEFGQVAVYLPWMALAYAFFAAYQPYLFLTAKSLGKQVRNAALAETGVNLVGNVVFIPIYGVYGAIGASIAAKAVHFGMKQYYYHQYLKALA